MIQLPLRFKLTLTLLIAASCLSQSLCANEIYKTVDEHGNIQFSDTAPNDQAEPVTLPDLNIEPGVTPRVRLSPEQPESPAAIQVWIAAPENNGVINPGALSFTVYGETNRALVETEYAQLLVNGKLYGNQSRVLSWSIGNLIRGEYQLEIQIVANGQIAASSGSQKVFVQRTIVR